MPRALLERGKGRGMALREPGVGFLHTMNVSKKFRTEQAQSPIFGLEGAETAEDFSAIVARHTDRSNFTSLLVQVEVGSAPNINAAIGEVHGTFRVIRKTSEKFRACGKHLKRLIAEFGDAPRHANIVVVAEHAPESVARKIARSGFLPSCNHARVQPARQ